MDIDNLRDEWKSIDVPPCGDETLKVERKVASGHGVRTLRGRLKRISLRLIGGCVAGVLCMIPFAPDHEVLAVAVSAFFIVMGVLHAVQYRMLSGMDPSNATMVDSIRDVCRLESFRRVRRMVGLALMVPLMVYMAMEFTDTYGAYVLPGCIAGLAVGCLAGVTVNRRATKLLREMKRQLACEN